LDDKIGGALERMDERKLQSDSQIVLYGQDREERMKVLCRLVWTHEYIYTTNIGLEQGFSEILRRVEDPGFNGRYPDMNVRPVPEQFGITFFIPRGSIGLTLYKEGDATGILFGLNDNFDNNGLEFKIKEIREIERQIAAILDNLCEIVSDALKESNAVVHSAALSAVR